MKTNYRNIPVQKVINFSETANFSRLVQAKRNIEEYLDKCDYSTENLTSQILAPYVNIYEQRRLVKTKLIILEERGAAYEFLTIIKKEMETRMQAHEIKMRAAK